MFIKLASNKNKPGRPVSIDKKAITKKCLDFYLLNGIHNQSFNNVIKHAGVSKGSIYRLYGSEDNLQQSALSEYYNIYIKDRLLNHKTKEVTLKSLIMDITSGLISNRYKVCLYHRSRMEKYKLGKLTKNFISKIEVEIEENYKQILRKELAKNKEKYSNNRINEIVSFILNGITTLNLLKLNRSSHKFILSYSNMLLKFVKNI